MFVQVFLELRRSEKSSSDDAEVLENRTGVLLFHPHRAPGGVEGVVCKAVGWREDFSFFPPFLFLSLSITSCTSCLGRKFFFASLLVVISTKELRRNRRRARKTAEDARDRESKREREDRKGREPLSDEGSFEVLGNFVMIPGALSQQTSLKKWSKEILFKEEKNDTCSFVFQGSTTPFPSAQQRGVHTPPG